MTWYGQGQHAVSRQMSTMGFAASVIELKVEVQNLGL